MMTPGRLPCRGVLSRRDPCQFRLSRTRALLRVGGGAQ